MPLPATTPNRDGLRSSPWTRRVFSTARGRSSFRRATDVFLLVPAVIGLVLLIALYPPPRFERALIELLRSTPGWLDPVWAVLYDTLALWALVLLVLALVARRLEVWLRTGASVVVAAAVAAVAARLALGDWSYVDDLLLLRVDTGSFPVLRLALASVVVLAVGPHLVRPLQTVGRWVLALGAVGALLVEVAPPSASAASLLVAVVAATTVRLALGTSAGQPATDDVVAALAELGVDVVELEPAARQPRGVFVARGIATDGRVLQVKVYGRDAYDTQLLEKAWRTALYAGEGPRARLRRLEAVEHEALVTLLAREYGVSTPGVVVAAEASNGDALLVLEGDARSLAALEPNALDDLVLASAWAAVTTLGDARIAHHGLDPNALLVVGDGVALTGFDAATIAANDQLLLVDRAQLLASTAVLVGVDRAAQAAVTAIGADGVEELLPYLQTAAFGSGLRRALREAEIEVDDLGQAVATAAGVEPPGLLQLRRITWGTAIQIALLALAVSTVVGAMTGLDYSTLGSYLRDASWGWVAAGLVVAQLPRLTQAVSTIGSVPATLPFVPVYVMQLATSFMNLALPSNLARMAVNIRFFQRQGIPPATSVTAGAVDSFASTVIQAILLAVLVLFGASSLELDLDTPSGPSARLVVVLACALGAGVAVVVLVRRLREAIRDRVRLWWPEVKTTLAGLRAGGKLAYLIGGSLATEVLFAVALGVFANAFGFDISLADLLVINISVSLLASFVPVPGGIGVAEFGLTVGLTAAGMPDELALVTALLYRVATFYLPPVWGWFALRWLQRNALL